MAATEQTLLYSLRSPTTPLLQKKEIIKTALERKPSPTLSQVVRDWLLQDVFLRARNQKDDQTILDTQAWALLLEAVSSTTVTTSLPTLPIFVSFITAYSARPHPDEELLNAAGTVCKKLIAGAMKKATVDAALEAYAALLKTSVVVAQRKGGDLTAWEEMSESWLKAFRGVVDAGKGGKKVRLRSSRKDGPRTNRIASVDSPSHPRQSLSYPPAPLNLAYHQYPLSLYPLHRSILLVQR